MTPSGRRPQRPIPLWLLAGAQLAVIAILFARPGSRDLLLPVLAGVTLAIGVSAWIKRRSLGDQGSAEPNLDRAAAWVDDLVREIGDFPTTNDVASADAMAESVDRLLRRVAPARGGDSMFFDSRMTPPIVKPAAHAALTRSGLFDSSSRASFLDSQSNEFTAVSDMLARFDPNDLRWLEATYPLQVFLGWSLAELQKMTFLEVVHPEHRELAREQLAEAIRKGEAHGLIFRIRTARGEPKAIEMHVSSRLVVEGDAAHLRCHVADATEKLRANRDLRHRTKSLLNANKELIQANRQLRELKDLYSDLYHHAPVMYFLLDDAAMICECNATMAEALGQSREEILGRSYASILQKNCRKRFGDQFPEAIRSGSIEKESRWVRADGVVMDVWVRGTGVVGPDGSITRLRMAAKDVTARKVLELQLQDKHARLALAHVELQEKNKELDDFSHVVSHDLQEPLRTLSFFTGLLKEENQETLSAEGRQHLEYLLDATSRMRSLIRDLLALSRAGRVTGESGMVDLDAIVDRVRRDFASRLGSNAGEIRVPAPLGTAWGDRDRVAQLLGNLISNGLKYHKPGEPAVVEISTRAEGDGSVEIAVRDLGIGIEPRDHARVFQVFRRLHTREEFEGTGAGLAICEKIARAHGGSIRIESEVGQGATFFVRLPGQYSKPSRAAACKQDLAVYSS